MPPNPPPLRRLLGNHKGATAIEYALIAGLIALVIIGAVTILGTSLSDTLTGVADAL
ncbi:MAG: Flp family type IVb pilin [Rhodospirillaceae bacterium]